MKNYIIIGSILVLFFLLILFLISSRTRIYKLYNKYIKVENKAGLNGRNFALIAMSKLNLDLSFALTKVKLGDGYNPKSNTLIFSEQVYKTNSIASIAIVGHELGHAVQDRQNSGLLFITRILTKITSLTNKLILPLIISGVLFYLLKWPTPNLGIIFSYTSLCLFLLNFFLQLLSIPLEYNASKIAMKFMENYGLISPSEKSKVNKLLKTAAQTYIARMFDGIFIFNYVKTTKSKKVNRK